MIGSPELCQELGDCALDPLRTIMRDGPRDISEAKAPDSHVALVRATDDRLAATRMPEDEAVWELWPFRDVLRSDGMIGPTLLGAFFD